jgi:low temperature requirement protein LtrA
LYFDLFYVSAAYNLSHGFKADPTINGFIWFVACYLPIFQIWNEKLVFDARYSPEDNIFHRSLELVRMLSSDGLLLLLLLLLTNLYTLFQKSTHMTDALLTIPPRSSTCVSWGRLFGTFNHRLL